MAYDTATLISKAPIGHNEYGLNIDFTGPGETDIEEQINVPTSFSVAQIKAKVFARVDALNNRAAIEAIPDGVAITAPAPPTPPTPDPDADAFLVKVGEVDALLRSVELGIMLSNDSRLTSRQTELVNMVSARQNLLFLLR